MKLSRVTSPENFSDLLFWPLVIFAAVVAIFVIGFVVTVVVLTRRSPGHHRQVAGHEGTNTYDASSHTTTTITVDKINVNSPRLPGAEMVRE